MIFELTVAIGDYHLCRRGKSARSHHNGSDVSKARHRYGESSDRSDPRQPVYCSDLGSDLFFGVFLFSKAIRSCAAGGAFTLLPRIMSFALSCCLYSFSLALPSERSVEPSSEMPANSPLDRE